MFERTEGAIQRVAGKAQEALGNATNDASVQAQGVARQAVGAAQQTYGEALNTVRAVTKDAPVATLACIAAAAFVLGAFSRDVNGYGATYGRSENARSSSTCGPKLSYLELKGA